MHSTSAKALFQQLQMKTPVTIKGLEGLKPVREALQRASRELGHRFDFDPASDSALMAYLASARPEGLDNALSGAALGTFVGGLVLDDPGLGATLGTRLGILAKNSGGSNQDGSAWLVRAVFNEKNIPVMTITPPPSR